MIPYDPDIIVEIVTEGGKIQVYQRKVGQEDEKMQYSIYAPTEIYKKVAEPVVLLIDYVDSNPLPAGAIAFETLEDSVVQIDNIVIIGIPISPTLPPTYTPRALEEPDLMIFSTDYGFKNDGRVLVLFAVIKNQGYVRTPETLVNVWEQDHEFPERASPVPGLSPGETTTLEILQELPEEQLGTTHTFLLEVDPHGDINELNEENNRQAVKISVPARRGGVPWYWIIPVLLAGGAAFSLKRWSNRRQAKIPKQIQVRLQQDIGSQQVESATPVRLDCEIRFRPVSDYGKQTIKTKGSLVIDKRRRG